MTDSYFNDLLDKYAVSDLFAKEVRTDYREELEHILSKAFTIKPKFRYGGSLSKGTANTNSCDIDLLCYLPSEEKLSVQEIFKNTELVLQDNSYIYEVKNSAICVKGRKDDQLWDMTVDIVPGKYISNDDNKDVFLWCNRDKCKLKSNPELQINKVKESNSKEIIRLIKLYRTFTYFKFKSFFLENFIIDIVEPEFDTNDSIMDRLVKFCKHWEDIGRSVVKDPANSDNDIMTMHNELEFNIIRNKIRNLYEALMTNDEETIINCFTNKSYDINSAYLKNAKDHSKQLSIDIENGTFITLEGYIISDKNETTFNCYTTIEMNKSLKFIMFAQKNLEIKSMKLIVSNAGYEAYKDNCLRGNAVETEMKYRNGSIIYVRDETTRYYGNHAVQALAISNTGKTYRSAYLVVRVR